MLGVCGFPPTKAGVILLFDLSQFVGVPMAGILSLFKDVPVILFSILVSDKF